MQKKIKIRANCCCVKHLGIAKELIRQIAFCVLVKVYEFRCVVVVTFNGNFLKRA